MNYYKSIPVLAGPLLELGGNMGPGLTAYGAALGLTITPAQLAAAVAAFDGDNNDFAEGRSALQVLSEKVVAALDALREWIAAVKNDLIGSFGPLWSAQWVQVGFQTPSVAIPTTRSAQATLAGMMIAFYTKQPAYEDAEKDLTAAYGKGLQAAIKAAQKAYTAREMAMKTLGTAWDTTYGALLKMERDVLKLLEVALPKEDPRWLEFGLALRNTSVTPGRPVNVSAHVDGTGAIVVTCDGVPLATRYRWRMLLVGVQSDYILAARSVDPVGMIRGVAPGQQVQIIVQAVNESLQGAASEPILFTMPYPEGGSVPLVRKSTPILRKRNGLSNGNGSAHKNGHARG